MDKYLDSLNDEVREYFRILCPDIPYWLGEYVDTPAMERIGKISINCGTDYSGCFDPLYWYSNLDHSVGVALILWNFTKDKKQTLAGLFHDIATPVFKHCIDFMNGDSVNQESTEDRTMIMIKNSKEIMRLLDRDGIKLEEVCDYKIYPLADNNTPRLSSDRMEYTFSSGLRFYRVFDTEIIRKIYNNIVIVKNEDGLDEFGFKNIDVCVEYIKSISKLWPTWCDDKDRTVMQFLADMCKSMIVSGQLSIDDLYTLSEEQVIDMIIKSDDLYLAQSFKKFQKTDTVYSSENFISDKYCVNVYSKTRYINPLVMVDGVARRIYDVSLECRNLIDEFLNFPKGGYYTYFDFDFKPYKTRRLLKD